MPTGSSDQHSTVEFPSQTMVDGARLELAFHGCRPWVIPLYEPPNWGEMRESNSRNWSHNPVPQPFGQSRRKNTKAPDLCRRLKNYAQLVPPLHRRILPRFEPRLGGRGKVGSVMGFAHHCGNSLTLLHHSRNTSTSKCSTPFRTGLLNGSQVVKV